MYPDEGPDATTKISHISLLFDDTETIDDRFIALGLTFMAMLLMGFAAERPV